MKKKNLTFRYSFHQMAFWAGAAGVSSFAVAYFLKKGYSSAQAGTVIFLALILSFILQPLVASMADKAKRNLLPILIAVLTAVLSAAFLTLSLFNIPDILFFILYLVGVACMDVQIGLLNAMNVYYASRGFRLNYSLGRAVGALGFSLTTLAFGYLLESANPDIMVYICVGMFIASALTAATYPKVAHNYSGISEADNLPAGSGSEADSLPTGSGSEARSDRTTASTANSSANDAGSIIEFFRRYKWYCISLFGVLFLAMFHSMTENYLIEIFGTMGGDSSNVGTALFIATLVETPGMAFFSFAYKRFSIKQIYYVAAVSYILKAVLFLMAGSIAAIYIAQMLQLTTYVCLSMPMVVYAEKCTLSCDMVKGQSMITAFYTLGCAIGNLIGGILVTNIGVRAMLIAGLCMAVTGAMAFFLTVSRALKQPKPA